MIKCDICRQNGVVTGLNISGHAGAGEYGSDIVCAGVSAIVLTALGSLQEMFGIDDFDGVDPDGEGGNVSFRLPDEFLKVGDLENSEASVFAQTSDMLTQEAKTTVQVEEVGKSMIDSIKVAAILDAMVIGLRQIEMQYSDYITVTEREV